MAEIAFLVGRILFGGYFFMNGMNHFLKRGPMTGYAISKGVPLPGYLVPFSGVLIILGGLGVVLGIQVPAALALIILFLVPVTLKMHAFWAISDPQAKMGEMVNFMKNTALIGATLMMYSLCAAWQSFL